MTLKNALHHKMFHYSRRHFLNVMLAIGARICDVSRVKRFLEMKVSPVPQRHHRLEMKQSADLAKVDLLYYSHALRKCGLFENMETTMNRKAAAKLKIGDRVRYTGEDSCPGTVTEANWHAVKIQYDDGVIQILHHDDAADIERLDERYDVTKAVA